MEMKTLHALLKSDLIPFLIDNRALCKNPALQGGCDEARNDCYM
jgi:hypothetical protein